MEFILVKLGGSIITDKEKPYTARLEVISKLSKEIAEASEKNPDLNLIIANGSGSFGHAAAKECNIEENGISEESAKYIRAAANKLNKIVLENLLDAGLKVVSLAVSSFTKKTVNHTQLDPQGIKKALAKGFMPLLHGDVIEDEEKGFSILSGEGIFEALIENWSQISELPIKKIIMLGETDGLLDEQGKTIPKITPNNFEELKSKIRASKKLDVTGGMLHKIETSLKLAKKGIPTLILSGETEGNLKSALLGQEVLHTHISLSG